MTALVTPIFMFWLMAKAGFPMWVRGLYIALVLGDMIIAAYRAGKGDNE